MSMRVAGWLDRALEQVGVPPLSASSGLRILLVDDSPENLQVLTDTLRPLGHALSVATNGEQALKLAKRSPPALVLLDVMMPGLDGFEVCRRMKEDPQLAEIPIVFCSALGESEARVHGLAIGAVDFITKPFDPGEVFARVATHLAIHQLLRGLEDRNTELERELAYARETRTQSLHEAHAVLTGKSAATAELRAAVTALAEGNEPLLLMADPGSGEEAVARAIHDASARRDRAFLRIECPRLRANDWPTICPANAGSDTSPFLLKRKSDDGTAVARPKKGAPASLSRLEIARGGTVFFEGIHRMADELRAPLMALVSDLEKAVAEGRKHPLDVRVICSTTSSAINGESSHVNDLWTTHARGRKALRLPSLSDRREDIPELVALFVQRHAQIIGRQFDSIAESTLRALERHWWPGNLRELEEVVRGAVLRSPSSTIEVDPRLLADGIPFGSYRLLRKLSEGGMGTLWEAEHQMLARPAVVKLIKGQLAFDRASLERRFELEARATAKLRSPNTVTLFDYGISEQGEFYYVMEKLEGIDLERAVDSYGPMPPGRVVHLLMQACRSLAEAHASGLVHRDIKPSNLFLCRLGLEVDVLKVLDFGVVKSNTDVDQSSPTAPAEQACGTPAFMSPEASTEPESIDGMADIYALGCVAYWMLTGTLPFEASTPTALVLKHLTEAPEAPSRRVQWQLPTALEDIVMRCLAKNRTARPTALELYAALEATHVAYTWDSTQAFGWWNLHLPALMNQQ